MPTAKIRNIFFVGLVTLLPVVATIYLVVWLVTGLESLLGSAVRSLLPEQFHVPGMGLAVGVLAVFFVGLLTQTWLTHKIWQFAERSFTRMPLVRPIYAVVKEIVGYASGANRPRGQAVVAVRIGDTPVRLLGLITRDELPFLNAEPDSELVAVFLPWSYQIGGFTVFVPRHALEPVALSPQEAFRLSFTAGVTTSEPPAS